MLQNVMSSRTKTVVEDLITVCDVCCCTEPAPVNTEGSVAMSASMSATVLDVHSTQMSDNQTDNRLTEPATTHDATEKCA